MGNKEQGSVITGGDVEEERVGGRGHVLPEEERVTKSPTGADVIRQSSTYWWCGNISSGGRRTAKRWRESMSPHSTNRGGQGTEAYGRSTVPKD